MLISDEVCDPIHLLLQARSNCTHTHTQRSAQIKSSAWRAGPHYPEEVTSLVALLACDPSPKQPPAPSPPSPIIKAQGLSQQGVCGGWGVLAPCGGDLGELGVGG